MTNRRQFLTVSGAGVAAAATARAVAPSDAPAPLPATAPDDIAAYGGKADGRTRNNAALAAAFKAHSDARPFFDRETNGYWGVGALSHGKGVFLYDPITFGQSNNVAMTVSGVTAGATVLSFDLARGFALTLRVYLHVYLHDFGLLNTAPEPGSSVAVNLDPTGSAGANMSGGGGHLQVERIFAKGFGTFIRNFGRKLGGIDTGDGDKTLVTMCNAGAATFYDQTDNKQAYGWTFLNNASGSTRATFRLGGAGETLIANHVGNVYGSFIELPEASGNPGSGSRSYFGQRVTVMSTKLEYSGPAERMLLDARASRLQTDSGGSNVDLVLREVSLASGTDWPDPASHVVIQVGDDRSGSDAIRVKQEGGSIEGVIRLGSDQLGRLNRRWSFRDAVRAPDPATVQLLGQGSHYLMEWRANENVPVDQYRGGEAFVGAIDAQKAFLWRHEGKALINTGVANGDIGGRRGADFRIGGFPRKTTVTGLAVFIDENRRDTDTRVEWFADPRFTRPIGAATIPADARGLRPVVMNDAARWQTLATGELYVRITKPGGDDAGTEGALVIFYFPYMGR